MLKPTMPRKSEHLQIRLTPREKAALKRRAAASGQDVSTYVLGRALPSARSRFEEILRALAEHGDHRFPLAELNDFLSGLSSNEIADAVVDADVTPLSPFLANYVAAMVEQACHREGLRPPGWTGRVDPLEAPHFATQLRGLHLHLLQSSPVPFKRRNLFVDAALGARV